MPTETDSQPQKHPSGSPAVSHWVRVGFFTALGVALLYLLALVVTHVAQAALEILTPFVIATVLALMMDPLVDRLQRRGLSRAGAVLLVFGLFLFVLIGLSAVAIPILVNQVTQLAAQGPEYIAKLQAYMDNFLAHHRRIGGYRLPANFNALTAQLSGKATQLLSNSAGQISAFLLGSITTLLNTLITLIVTFYLLLDIDRLQARLFYLLPERVRGPAHAMAKDVSTVFAEYLRGLLIVSALYGACTLVLLLILSLAHHDIAQYALLVGVAAGLLYIVPYLGPLVTALITFLVAFAAGGLGFGVVGVVCTLVLNQAFDNVITPRIVGGGVGLHPVASLFALALGGALFGLWGLLLSVPVAASIQVILFRLFPKLASPTPPSFLQPQEQAATTAET